jgi:hypothetical protein
MMEQLDIFGPQRGGSHSDDPVTSHHAAENRNNQVRWGSQRHALLEVFAETEDEGLTDEEAGHLAEVGGYNEKRRCSELRSAGLIEPTGRTAVSSLGATVRICRITTAGRQALMRAFSESREAV